MTILRSDNYLTISNLNPGRKTPTDNYIYALSDFALENSWRNTSSPDNVYASWMFVKCRVHGVLLKIHIQVKQVLAESRFAMLNSKQRSVWRRRNFSELKEII